MDCRQKRSAEYPVDARRFGEHGEPPPYRSKRIFRVNGHWYFDTREGIQFGPFPNQAEAREALAVFVAQDLHEVLVNRSHGSNRPGTQDGIAHMVKEVFGILRCYRDFGPRAADTWARSRLEHLALSGDSNSTNRECMGVLRYVMKNTEQTFDFGLFLESYT